MPKVVTYTDSEGFKRQSLLPDGSYDDNPESGIPVSVDLTGLNLDFDMVEFSNRLFERGLIQPEDFEKSGAIDIINEVLRNMRKLDAYGLIAFVRSQKGIKQDG